MSDVWCIGVCLHFVPQPLDSVANALNRETIRLHKLQRSAGENNSNFVQMRFLVRREMSCRLEFFTASREFLSTENASMSWNKTINYCIIGHPYHWTCLLCVFKVLRWFLIGWEMRNPFEPYQNSSRNFCSAHIGYLARNYTENVSQKQ